jgi:putative phosphoribosyl transferase
MTTMETRRVFGNRREAGQLLGAALIRYRKDSPIVLGLPRGGVPVAREVAGLLGAPLDMWIVRKVGAPGNPELGVGAVAEGGEVFIDEQMIGELDIADEEVSAEVARKHAELEERARRLRRGAPPPDVTGRTVIVVDDGIATGVTARAALRAIRRRGAGRVVLAAPVGAVETLEALSADADDVVCLEPIEGLGAVGFWYDDFSSVSDGDVLEILEERRRSGPVRDRDEERALGVSEKSIDIDIGKVVLHGDLALPAMARALVVFAHGSGSSRKSPRNRFVADVLQRAGLGTLLFDLLTRDEEKEDALDAHLRFDIDLLAQRLVQVTDWLRSRPVLNELPIGYFGASTGAAAALIAAAERPEIMAVVSRGGRPDLAAGVLPRVVAPTLLIVGGADEDVLLLNRQALRRLAGPKRLAVVAGATHLFEEPGALEQVASLAADWFGMHLRHLMPEARV